MSDQPDEKQILAEATRRIASLFAPKQMLPFGSRAGTSARPDSDFDLAVIVDDGAHPANTAVAIYGALAGIGAPFDVLVFNETHWHDRSESTVTTEHHIAQTCRVVYDAAAQ